MLSLPLFSFPGPMISMEDPLLLSTLCPALLTMTIFTAWGAGPLFVAGLVGSFGIESVKAADP